MKNFNLFNLDNIEIDLMFDKAFKFCFCVN